MVALNPQIGRVAAAKGYTPNLNVSMRLTITRHGTVTITPKGQIVMDGFVSIGTFDEALAEVRQYLREIVADDAKWLAHVAPDADPAIEPAP